MHLLVGNFLEDCLDVFGGKFSEPILHEENLELQREVLLSHFIDDLHILVRHNRVGGVLFPVHGA